MLKEEVQHKTFLCCSFVVDQKLNAADVSAIRYYGPRQDKNNREEFHVPPRVAHLPCTQSTAKGNWRRLEVTHSKEKPCRSHLPSDYSKPPTITSIDMVIVISILHALVYTKVWRLSSACEQKEKTTTCGSCVLLGPSIRRSDGGSAWLQM